MDYEKKYKEALERAKKLYGEPLVDNALLEIVFPELKESEDERIRKYIIGVLEDLWQTCSNIEYDSTKIQNAIAWLEKQKEQSIISHKFNVGDWIVSKWGGIYQIKEVMLGSYNLLCTNNAEEINSITQVDNNSRLLCISDIKKLEKQGEQKDSVVDFKAKDWYVSKVDGKIRNIYHSVDEVEPKFKVGDWVVYNRNDSSREILYVYDIRDGRYYFNDNVHFSWSIKECDEKSHLWTIQDAKPGDVLVYHNTATEIIMLFKSWVVDRVEAYTHFHIFDNDYRVNDSCDCGNGAHPATKEQRDQLEKAMADAGYTFDFEKKELKLFVTNGDDFDEKNCEQKHSIDINKMVDDYANNKEPGNEEFGKPVPCMVRAYRQGLNDAIGKNVLKPAWGENEMKMLDNLITYLNGSKGLLKETKSIYTDLLKSLKERIKNA